MLLRMRTPLVLLAAAMVALFLLRLAYGYAYPYGDQESPGGFAREFSFSRKNYASEKKAALGGGLAAPVDQKYEKIGSLSATTSEFERDERRLRELVPRHKALLQFEQSAGLAGRRHLDVAIGVPPAAFDVMVRDLRQIGKLEAIRIDKSDKTNEYRELQAKRLSLEKTRDALLKLRAAGNGRMEELMQLENRLLEIENEIQGTGVKLGDFDTENEFCTVKFSLTEGAVRSISLATRIKVALEWMLQYGAMLVFVAAMGLLAVWALLQIADRFRRAGN
jgi:hypothetical protein